MSQIKTEYAGKRFSILSNQEGYSFITMTGKDEVVGAAVAVYCKTTKRFLLVKELRPTYSFDFKPTWNIMKGGIEKNESSLQNAKRELEEETGISLDSDYFIHLTTARFDSGAFPCKLAYYLAVVDYEPPTKAQPDEILEVSWFSLDDIKELIKKGELCDSITFSIFGLISLLNLECIK